MLPASTEVVSGAIEKPVSVWFTVTFTLLVVESPSLSRIVTRKLYVPAFVNVAIVFFDALVPLALKVTAAGGVPVVAQV